MSGEDLLRALAGALRGAGIPFMLTGSVAAAYYGAGRATMDIDVVIDPPAGTVDDLVARVLALGAYVSKAAAREAVANRAMFNVVDPRSGWKADLMVRKTRPFSEAEFKRRRPIEFLGVTLDVASLEDVVLSKLEWAKLGGSARQLEDVRALLRVGADELDRAYVEQWVALLGVEVQWRAVTGASAP